MLKHLRKSEDFEQKNLLQKGFTLVELLVVIVILGILAAVVVFAVGGSTDNAQTSACKAEKSTAESAVEAYRVKAGSYPTAWSQVTADGETKFLRSEPANYNLGANGAITAKAAADGGKCA